MAEWMEKRRQLVAEDLGRLLEPATYKPVGPIAAVRMVSGAVTGAAISGAALVKQASALVRITPVKEIPPTADNWAQHLRTLGINQADADAIAAVKSRQVYLLVAAIIGLGCWVAWVAGQADPEVNLVWLAVNGACAGGFLAVLLLKLSFQAWLIKHRTTTAKFRSFLASPGEWLP